MEEGLSPLESAGSAMRLPVSPERVSSATPLDVVFPRVWSRARLLRA